MAPTYWPRFISPSAPIYGASEGSISLDRRAAGEASNCITTSNNQLVISRPAFIASLTLCIAITLLSLVTLAAILFRQRIHQRKISAWGRRSHYGARISIMRKEVDDAYTRQYKGVWVGDVVENPEMGSDSPVEMSVERRVWEVPAVPAVPSAFQRSDTAPAVPPKAAGRSAGRKSLWFDQVSGLWLPKT